MSIVRCLAADALWRDPLLGSARGTVESSFAHAVNVRFDDLDQALLTLTTAAGRPAPGALLTEVEEFARYSPGTRVRISQGVLHLAGLRLGLDGCSWFDTRVRPLSSGSPDPLPLRAFLADAAPPPGPVPSRRPWPLGSTAPEPTSGRHSPRRRTGSRRVSPA